MLGVDFKEVFLGFLMTWLKFNISERLDAVDPWVKKLNNSQIVMRKLGKVIRLGSIKNMEVFAINIYSKNSIHLKTAASLQIFQINAASANNAAFKSLPFFVALISSDFLHTLQRVVHLYVMKHHSTWYYYTFDVSCL